MKISIYVEGGGDGNALRTKCREAFRKFFEKATLKGRMPKIIACGSRNNAYDSFCTALNVGSNELPLLLVDSESLVKQDVWGHLKNRDQWARPKGAEDEQAHLMVQCMEAWFLADREQLETFFGQGFNGNALPDSQQIEQVGKQQIFEGLKAATRYTKTKGKYGKGEHSFDILGLIDPNKVAHVSPHTKRLLDTMKTKSG